MEIERRLRHYHHRVLCEHLAPLKPFLAVEVTEVTCFDALDRLDSFQMLHHERRARALDGDRLAVALRHCRRDVTETLLQVIRNRAMRLPGRSLR
jgi:hypothetical protein